MADSVKTPDDAPKQLQQGKRPLQLIWSSLLLEGWLGPNPLFHFQNFSQSAVSLEGCGEAAVEMEVRQEGEITRWCIEAQPRSRVPGGATSASLFPSMAVATLLFTVLFLWAKAEWKNLFQHRAPRGSVTFLRLFAKGNSFGFIQSGPKAKLVWAPSIPSFWPVKIL